MQHLGSPDLYTTPGPWIPFKGNPSLGSSWVPFKGTQEDPGDQEGLFWVYFGFPGPLILQPALKGIKAWVLLGSF